MPDLSPTAVILAAGLGTRMGVMSGPKCLLRLPQGCILEHQLRALAGCGVRNCIIVTGHRADEVEETAGSLAGLLGITLRPARNGDFATTGTAASLAAGLNAVDVGDVLVLEGDTVIDPRAVAALVAAGGGVRTLTDTKARLQQGSKILADKDGRALDWLHTRHQPPDFSAEGSTKTVNATYLPAEVAHGDFAAAVRQAAQDAPVEFAFRQLIRGGRQVRAMEMGAWAWCEVDEPEDLRMAWDLPLYEPGLSR